MNRRGRKPQIAISMQIDLFKKYHVHLQKKNLKNNDPIFSIISEEIDAKMSPKALFMSFQRNYNKSAFLDLQPSPFQHIYNLWCFHVKQILSYEGIKSGSEWFVL